MKTNHAAAVAVDAVERIATVAVVTVAVDDEVAIQECSTMFLNPLCRMMNTPSQCTKLLAFSLHSSTSLHRSKCKWLSEQSSTAVSAVNNTGQILGGDHRATFTELD